VKSAKILPKRLSILEKLKKMGARINKE